MGSIKKIIACCLVSLLTAPVVSQVLAAPADVASTSVQPVDPYYVNPVDPYEKFNRVMYRFNDIVDRVIMKPIATLYNKIMPKPLVTGIRHFFDNFETVPTIVNDVLQANFYQATRDAWRFGVNSTVGILGFFDVATDMGLTHNKEDFGLTLAQWGYKNSGYLVLPFLGPSTTRDAIGIPVTYYISLYPYINPSYVRNSIFVLSLISHRAELLAYENVMDQAAVDKYVFLRDAYLQRRAWLIQRNKELGDPYLEKETSAEEEDGDAALQNQEKLRE